MGAALSGICIFCKNGGSFKENDFIVPQSLGNKTDILKGLICGSCIKKLSSEVVKPVMEKSLLRKKEVRSILAGATGNSALQYDENELKLLGRMLGKMGLEFLALSSPLLPLKPAFDDLRNYVLNGAPVNNWAFYKGNRTIPAKFEEGSKYKYSLGIRGTDEYIFLFSTLDSIMLISLTQMLPDSGIAARIKEVELKTYYYS